MTVALPGPTADPLLLTRAAKALLPKILDGVKYARAGIVVTDIRHTGAQETFESFVNPHEAKGIGPLTSIFIDYQQAVDSVIFPESTA